MNPNRALCAVHVRRLPMHKRGARVVLERFQQVVQPQVADVVVVEVERGQRLVLLESLAQQLGALVRVRVRVRVSILLTSCRTTSYYGERRGGSCCR